MVVKKEQKRPRGRPPGDPDDLRTERIAIRVHPDLVGELNALARLEGSTRSVMIEKLLIRLVNDHHRATIVDAVGRYTGYAVPAGDPRLADQASHHSIPPTPFRRPVPKRK